MAFQTVFRRYELKYILNPDQADRVLAAMAPYMQPDRYGSSVVRSIYYDTENYQLIRRSLEGPVYKEKLRVRSYCQADSSSTVFVELKKKYRSVVYKRRLPLAEADAMAWLSGSRPCPKDSQIAREIDSFLARYQPLQPAAFLSCQREAFCTREPSDFRVTFDRRILFRDEALSLREPVWGTPLLPEDAVLMEVKCAGGMPLWMAAALSAGKVCRTSFSKYGTAYRSLIFPNGTIQQGALQRGARLG